MNQGQGGTKLASELRKDLLRRTYPSGTLPFRLRSRITLMSTMGSDVFSSACRLLPRGGCAAGVWGTFERR